MSNKHINFNRNILIIIVGANEHYPYPYKGNVIFHLDESERRAFRNYLSGEIERREKMLSEQRDSGEWGELLFGYDSKTLSIIIRELRELIKKFLAEEVILSADDFRFLSLQTNGSIMCKDSVPPCIITIVASGIKTYFNLENKQEGEVNEWIERGAKQILSEADAIKDSVLEEYGLK